MHDILWQIIGQQQRHESESGFEEKIPLAPSSVFYYSRDAFEIFCTSKVVPLPMPSPFKSELCMYRKYIPLTFLVYCVCLSLFVVFAHPFLLSLSSLKMEAEKLAQEKTEIQRQYIMVGPFFACTICICVCITEAATYYIVLIRFFFFFSTMKCLMVWMWRCINR